MNIPVIDLFAGPGGLGEGFSALDGGNTFKILVSVEMESSAHQTLSLRSYFRKVRGERSAAKRYYSFCNGETSAPYDSTTESAWKEANDEAQQFELGNLADNAKLDTILNQRLNSNEHCVLIGGPPCQAYSLVGRSRNLGKSGYIAADDHRHFLYREYLRIIQTRRPAVFVMENVKGILSAKVAGENIFQNILTDLSDPEAAISGCTSDAGYCIYSLVTGAKFEKGMDPNSIDPRDFIIRAEEYGIPQARHRVILLGIRADVAKTVRPQQLARVNEKTVIEDVLTGLPSLRSKLSHEEDSGRYWADTVIEHLNSLAKDARSKKLNDLAKELKKAASAVDYQMPTGSLRFPGSKDEHLMAELRRWYLDPHLKVWLNHESRSHMSGDLRRYAYAATFARLYGISPKGHDQFGLDGLRPNHQNWESGKFSDRFRVQRYGAPSTTITSHISKDGHYFIHPDPLQCRSLTVREAARLQTFPDNYFFMGNRTQQYHQVGNAVPPLLANRIAAIVKNILS